MNWQTAVLIKIGVSHILGPTINKKISGLPSRTRRLCWMFGFCFIFSLIFLFGVRLVPSPSMAWVMVIGLVNSLALYCSWRSINISLSKAALLTQADDLIAIGLAWFVLKDGHSLTWTGVLGVSLCLVAVGLFLWPRNTGDKHQVDKINEENLALFGWVAGYSILWGLDMFIQRYVAILGMPIPEYVFWRYSSSFLGAMVIFWTFGQQESGEKLTWRGVRGVLVLAMISWSSMLLEYFAFTKAPLPVVQPIFQVTESIFPAIIGLYVFKEKNRLQPAERLAFVIGLAGCLILAIKF